MANDRTQQGAASDIAPGLVSRVASGVRWMVTGKLPATVDPDSWFGPLNPLPPMAPPETAGRQFDYPVGYNLVTQPRQSEPFSFRQLRALAESYDLLRLVIETRKDQIARLHWLIQPKNVAISAASDPRCAQLMDFFARPDRDHGWDAWLRMILEDMLVIDSATLYPRRTLGGQIYALEPIDGATIKRVIDPWGRTPLPPAPAYQQVLKGLPAIDYAAGELFYLPRNPRTDRIYGYSPVEQVAMTVNIALRRQLHQLQYYTEGTVPDALIGVPETWSPDQIGQFQAYWDALLEGDTAQRRHTRFVPATISKSFVQTKDAALKDEYDEWLARIICYAFSVSPQWAVKQMNRATADSAKDQASEEGLEPLMRWVKGMIDQIIATAWGWPDLEFQWREDKEPDGLAQAQISQIYLASGVLSINEVRAAQGLDPVQGGEQPTIATKDGVVTLKQAVTPPPIPSPSTGNYALDVGRPHT
jgi:phage portal protein BeeE